MLTYLLQPRSTIPLYEQLYRAIRADIMAGILKSGEKLPSKRALAAHLKLSTATVETAYGQLTAEGYLESAPRRGYFVQALSSFAHAPKPPAPVLPSARPAEFMYDLRTHNIDTAGFPFSIWTKLSRQVLTESGSALLETTPPQGAPHLREQIQQYLYHFRGLDVQAEQIIVGAGSEYLLNLLIQLLGRDACYALEDPGYPKVHKTFHAGGATVLPLPLDQDGLRIDCLRDAHPDIVYLTPSHHFPTGVVMPAARRLALLQWAYAAPARYLIEDDYDSELRYSSRPIPALKGLDHADRVIYLNTFAQSLAPGLRIGYMVLPRPLAENFRAQLGFYSSTVPSFEQETLARFMQSGAFERHISRNRNLYKKRRDGWMAALGQSHLSPHLSLSGGDAGLHLLIQMHPKIDEAILLSQAAANGIGLSGLSPYYLAAHCPPATVLLGYGGLPQSDIPKAVEQLCKAWLPLVDIP